MNGLCANMVLTPQQWAEAERRAARCVEVVRNGVTFLEEPPDSGPPASLWTAVDKSATCPPLPTGDPRGVGPTA